MNDERTPEQIEADEALEAAIIGVSNAQGDAEGKFLSCFITVAAFADPEDRNRTEYVLAMTNGTMPLHTCLGLLQIGSDLVGESEET